MKALRIASLVGACALFSSTVRAATPAGSDDTSLPTHALTHLRRGAEHYARGDYPQAQREFGRVQHFAPQWAPGAFNMGVASEAIGKLDDAIASYEQFLPHASPEQKQAVELRIRELEQRRERGIRTSRQQLAIASSAIAGGLLMAGGGTTMLVLGYRKGRGEEGRQTLMTAGYVVGVAGLTLSLALGVPMLRKALHTKRTVAGLAFTPTGSRRGVGGEVTFSF